MGILPDEWIAIVPSCYREHLHVPTISINRCKQKDDEFDSKSDAINVIRGKTWYTLLACGYVRSRLIDSIKSNQYAPYDIATVIVKYLSNNEQQFVFGFTHPRPFKSRMIIFPMILNRMASSPAITPKSERKEQTKVKIKLTFTRLLYCMIHQVVNIIHNSLVGWVVYINRKSRLKMRAKHFIK